MTCGSRESQVILLLALSDGAGDLHGLSLSFMRGRMQSQESPVAILTFGWAVVGFLRDLLRLPLSMQIEILTLRHLTSAAA